MKRRGKSDLGRGNAHLRPGVRDGGWPRWWSEVSDGRAQKRGGGVGQGLTGPCGPQVTVRILDQCLGKPWRHPEQGLM